MKTIKFHSLLLAPNSKRIQGKIIWFLLCVQPNSLKNRKSSREAIQKGKLISKHDKHSARVFFFVKLWRGMKTHYALEWGNEMKKWDVEVLFAYFVRISLENYYYCLAVFFRKPLMTGIKACLIFKEFFFEV